MELTIEEVAKRINMPVETVERWIRQGKIPMHRRRGRYTIRSEMLDRWAAEYRLRIQALPAEAPAASAVRASLAQSMRRGGVVHGLEADSKEQSLRAAVEHIPHLTPEQRMVLLEKLGCRERLASTGIGHGIALPHPRNPAELGLGLPQITTCFLARPIDFDAIDRRPVTVLLIVLGISTQQHLILLSRLSFYLRDRTFRDFLLAAPAVEQLTRRIEQLESDREADSL